MHAPICQYAIVNHPIKIDSIRMVPARNYNINYYLRIINPENLIIVINYTDSLPQLFRCF